jgi:topoisomerase-4 subunit B
LKIIFYNEFTKETKTFFSEQGINEYVTFINDNKSSLNKVAYFSGKANDVEVEVALQYVTTCSEVILSFANSIKTKAGGYYVTVFKSCLTEAINNIARKWKLLKDKDKNFEGEDVREGLTAVISVRVPEKIIQYKNQTKDELSTIEAGTAMKKVFGEKFAY